MKVFLTIAIFGIAILPSIYAWSFKNPLSSNESNKPMQQNISNPVVVPVNTTLYQQYICMNNLDGTLLIVPGNCTSYFLCLKNKAIIQSCKYPAPHYDPVLKNCVSKSTCEDRDIVVSGGPKGCKGVCCGKPPGLYVDPESKYRFYFCKNNIGVLHSCCKNEQFNPINLACDVPANCP